MKTTNQSQTERTQAGKARKVRGPVQRDAKEVMAELVARLSQKLDAKPSLSRDESNVDRALEPNRDRLTVGVDLGDKWSNYCILGLDGETLVEGELQTSQQDFSEFFSAVMPARVVMEVGTHSAWARDVVAGCGHEVLVANPRQMEGPKRRKRKNDFSQRTNEEAFSSGYQYLQPGDGLRRRATPDDVSESGKEGAGRLWLNQILTSP